jgi:hypothetical protein
VAPCVEEARGKEAALTAAEAPSQKLQLPPAQFKAPPQLAPALKHPPGHEPVLQAAPAPGIPLHAAPPSLEPACFDQLSHWRTDGPRFPVYDFRAGGVVAPVDWRSALRDDRDFARSRRSIGAVPHLPSSQLQVVWEENRWTSWSGSSWWSGHHDWWRHHQ